MKKAFVIVAAVLSAALGSNAFADTPRRADWMAGKRGMMVHWLFGEPGRIDYYVNAFDINKFMADFDETKSDYLVFTVGQNAGVYASPNSKITEYAGAGHCPTRDLVGEIAAAVHARGKKFIAYLPCELNANTTLHEGFGWPAAGSGKDMSTFQERWREVIREWALRWGSNLDGWWIDGYTDGGTHWPDAMSGADEALWAADLRAGNANAVITFNNGLAKKTPRAGAVLSDYLAGEINYPGAISDWTLTEFAEGTTDCRTHFLMPIDGFWGGYWSWDQAGGANPYSGRGLPNQQAMDRLSYVGLFPDPVVSEDDLRTMIQNVFAVNGAVTINIGVNASGTLNPKSVALLAKMPGGSASSSAPTGTTVESLIGDWSSAPMASDGSTFSTDGDLVYAYSTASADKTVNGITFTGLGSAPATASADFEFSPAFNTTQNAESDGMSGDLQTIAKLAWKNSEKATGGYATMTFKGLTAGKRYCIQLYIHDTYCHNSAVFGPDAKSVVFYRSEESDPKTGLDWTCGGVFTGIIAAKGTTHEITLNYPTTDRVELNALQVRCLGDAGEDPGPVAADPDTSWMKDSFGVSFHWTAKIVNDYGSKNWEQAVANFDVKKFADSVESFGAEHVIFTVAHAWQQMPCPCDALDTITQAYRDAGGSITDRTASRDLMKDIIDELTNRNIRVVFYYNHSCNHNEDDAWEKASGFEDIVDEASMQAFGSKICSIVRELSLRYGDGVSAWWFDSATSVDDSEPWPNNKKANSVAGLRFPWNDLFAAARSGNPRAAVAVNWDVHAVDQHGLVTDYLSGETEKINAYGNFFPFAPDGFQDHIWTRMDSKDWFWQGGEVSKYGSRFTEDQLAWWRASHRAAGRMATLNVVIDEAGNINPVVATQLVNTATIGMVWVQGRYDPYTWQPASSNLLANFTDADGAFAGGRPGVPYQRKYNTTGISVLTDGAIPNSENFYTGDITVADSEHLFGATNGAVFAWTLKESSDVYGINIFTRGVRSQYNAQTGGSHDSIVVSKIEFQHAGSSAWTEINGLPAVSVGIGSDDEGVSGGALTAKLVDCTGAPLATSATAVRITFGTLKNNDSIFAEFEVIGCKAAERPDQPPEEPEEPEEIPVCMLTVPTKAGLVLDSVKTNSIPVTPVGNVYSIISNTEVTIIFTAASGYELDGNDGKIVKTIESDTTLADADYPAVKEQGGGEDPVDPPPGPGPGELVNGRANMKGWAMKRVTIAAKGASETGLGWSATDDPSGKSYSAAAPQVESVMVFNEAQVVNTIQLFTPKSENNSIPQVVGQMPSAFKIYGSNDGSSWTELLSVTGESDWISMECRYFTFKNETAYTQYKLAVESTVGGGNAKLGVYNYYQAVLPDPTIPWTYSGGKLTRGDQQFTNVQNLEGQLKLQYADNASNTSLYDLDFTAGFIDGSGNKIDKALNISSGLKGSAFITRIVGDSSVLMLNTGGYSLENCYYLNEVDFVDALDGAGNGTFKKCLSLQHLNESKWTVTTIQNETFMSCYNLCGDIAFTSVLTNKAPMSSSMITSVSMPKIEYFGNGNDWMAAFGSSRRLTNIVFGANLTTVNCGQFLGKIVGPTSVYFNSAPPTFEMGETSIFNDKSDWTVTVYLPLGQQTEWTAYAESKGNNFTLPDGDAPGTWISGKKAYVRWWSEEPSAKQPGTCLFVW